MLDWTGVLETSAGKSSIPQPVPQPFSSDTVGALVTLQVLGRREIEDKRCNVNQVIVVRYPPMLAYVMAPGWRYPGSDILKDTRIPPDYQILSRDIKWPNAFQIQARINLLS